MDEYTRECLALQVNRSLTSEDVIDMLAELFAQRRVVRYIQSDNGPEFVLQAIQRWQSRLQIQTLYIAPRSSCENGYAEELPQPPARRVPWPGGV